MDEVNALIFFYICLKNNDMANVIYNSFKREKELTGVIMD